MFGSFLCRLMKKGVVREPRERSIYAGKRKTKNKKPHKKAIKSQ